MARSFLNSTTAAQVKAAAPQIATAEFKDRIAMGMAIGGCYRAGMSRTATLDALVKGPAHLSSDDAEIGIDRWEKNQKFYGKVVSWTEK